MSFWDAARFCNWLHNGQGNGDTETGAYINIGDQYAFARQTGAKFFIPSENEWYKAAYYDPAKSGDAGYWDYPTQSDGTPTAEAPPGSDFINGSLNSSDNGYVDGTYYSTEVGAYNTTTTLGEYVSDSFYGTFDQGGNVAEWNESVYLPIRDTDRVIRGGAFGDDSIYAHVSSRSAA